MKVSYEDAQKMLREKEKEVEKEQNEAKLKGLKMLTIAVGLTWIISSLLWGWFAGCLIAIVSVVFFGFLVSWFVWGPQDVWIGCFVAEGYCAYLEVGGKISRIIVRRKGYCLDPEGFIVPETEEYMKTSEYKRLNNHLNILNFYFFWPLFFEKVSYTSQVWEKVKGKEVITRVEVLRRISVRPYPFYDRTDNAEDKERLKTSLGAMVEGTIVHPFLARFGSSNWLEMKSNYMSGGFDGFIKKFTLSELMKNKKILGNMIFDYLLDVEHDPSQAESDKQKEVAEKILNSLRDQELKDRYLNATNFLEKLEIVFGIKITQIIVKDIEGSDDEINKALQAKEIARLQYEATVVNTAAKAFETGGRFVGNLASLTGMSTEDVQEKLRDTGPDAFNKGIVACATWLTDNSMLLDEKALSRIEVKGAGVHETPSFPDAIMAMVARDLSVRDKNPQREKTQRGGENSAMLKELKDAGIPVDTD